MNLLFVVSELAPYSKTGGLADVAAALPKALAATGVTVRVVTPRYGFMTAAGEYVGELRAPFGFQVQTARVFREARHGVETFFIDAPAYFHRGRKLYGEPDDPARFAFFSRSAIELARWFGEPPDVIHGNDWMTGLIPVYLRSALRGDPFFARVATVTSIHNLAFQGFFDLRDLPYFGLPGDLQRGPDGLEFGGAGSMLKGGILASDALTTVSERYAQEIQTPEYGFRMDALLRMRRHDLVGILNGVDYDEWNPATDAHLAARYTPADLSGKRLCKADLLKRFGMPVELDRPAIVIVSRLSDQKGLDLVRDVAWRILHAGAYFILLGAGDPRYEVFFQHLRDTAPRRVGVYFGLNEALAHQIEAGGDMFLMPSAYEPCGLNQIYSLKYGTVPIVRATGGLDDTIQDFDRVTGTGNGLKFRAYNANRLMEKIYEGLLLYRQPETWRALQRNGMQADFSWARAAWKYRAVYERVRAA
ncbi:MAG: starch synthase [Chloracidobacterium sp. CP2_5A]|nr:MAG: starch synthase [Chloracidobacterium sp. CP2_5A]